MCDKQVVETLIQKLDKFNSEQAPDIVEQIITCGEVALEPLLVAFFTGKQTTEKEYILQSLAVIINRTELIEILLKYLDRMRSFARYFSIKYLFEAGDKSIYEKLVPYMIADLGGHYFCSEFATEALPKCGEMAVEPMISALMEQSKSQSEYYDDRFTTLIWVLSHLDDHRVIEPLISALYLTRNKEIFHSFVWAFERLGRRIVPALLQVIRNKDASLAVKKCALASLNRIPDKRSVNDLISLLDHQDLDLRQSAVAALGVVQDKVSIPHLIQKLQTDPHEYVRAEAANALGMMKDDRAIPALIGMMKNDPFPNVRSAAAFSLRHYKTPEVLTALIETLHDDEITVAIRSRYVLDTMGSDARPLLQKLHAHQPEVIDRVYNTWDWEFVNSCRQNEEMQPVEVGLYLPNTEEFYADKAHNCPICEKPGAELTWVFLSTPPETWRMLVGRAGWLTICDDCHIQVDFFLEAMN